jgi:Trk-type K+ transport system membrane component
MLKRHHLGGFGGMPPREKIVFKISEIAFQAYFHQKFVSIQSNSGHFYVYLIISTLFFIGGGGLSLGGGIPGRPPLN